MNWVYSDIVKNHFVNPRNVLEDEASFEADGRGVAGNVQCGDEMLVVIRVDPATQVITECRWQTYGCASAIASTSMLSEAVKGLTLDEALRIGAKEIVARLGGLPDHKIHCSVLGDKALRAAIYDYRSRQSSSG